MSVWVEMPWWEEENHDCRGHAPRERVSWNISAVTQINKEFVTLHVSVWVEISSSCKGSWLNEVTLHVSVWVEMYTMCISICSINVTLHVSVWVEMKVLYQAILSSSHAPRERVSWNLNRYTLKQSQPCHAPRERVSWNVADKIKAINRAVTLHVSVWVEIFSGR